jgi:hypothetical protein
MKNRYTAIPRLQRGMTYKAKNRYTAIPRLQRGII